MERIVHDLVPDSPEWHAFRYEHDGASEAAAMLGLSKTMTRTELLHIKATGTPREFSDFVQKRVLDKGKEVEALARPIAAEIVGSTLYPVTCSLGRTSASTDGLDMADEVSWEHKLINRENVQLVRAGQVPEEHMPQCQQVLMVTGAERLLFMVSDGTRENMAHVWVEPDTTWFDRLRAGWVQFNKDRETYVPAEVVVKPIGKTMEVLPSLRVELKGEVTASNLADFKDYALEMIGSINRELTTDQHFADAAKAVKWCGDVKDRMVAVKEQALAQTETIDALFRTIDSIIATADEVRLELDRLVKRRNTELKDNMVLKAQKAYSDHVAAIEVELKPIRLAALSAPNFAEAIKGKRSFVLMQDAIDTAMAAGKIAADAQAKDLRAKLAWIKVEAEGFGALFADLQALIQKPVEDFQMVVKARVTEQKTKNQKLIDDAAAATKAAAELAATPAPALVAAPVANVVQMPTPQESAARILAARLPDVQKTPPTLKLGQIGERLGFSLTGDFLKNLGFEPAARDKSALLFHESDFPLICAALVTHIIQVQTKQAA